MKNSEHSPTKVGLHGSSPHERINYSWWKGLQNEGATDVDNRTASENSKNI